MKMVLVKTAMAIVSIVLIGSCNRSDETTPTGGKGGNAILKVTPQHHFVNVDSCMVYIKYNATNTPASYDDSAKCIIESGVPVATFSQLKKGNYYLFGQGWDTTIKQTVKGGVTYEITQEQTINIFLPVTEPH